MFANNPVITRHKIVKKANGSRSYKVKLFSIACCCFAFVLVFSYIPLFGWIYAFYDYKPGLKLFECAFVGLKFFKLAIKEPELLTVLRNTLAIGFLGILVSPLPAFFAILLSEMCSKRFRSIVQTTTTLPYFISWVIVYSIFYVFFSPGDGFINMLLQKLKLMETPIDPLSNVKITWYLQTAIGLWKHAGFNAIIYLAAIVGIDQELFNAAAVDGAGRFKIILHITIPCMVPTFLNLLLINIGLILANGFEQYYLFYNPLVHNKIQVLDYYLYRIGIMTGDYPLSTALGMSKTMVSVVLLFTANWISKKLRGQSLI